jgi:hypothetical protein
MIIINIFLLFIFLYLFYMYRNQNIAATYLNSLLDEFNSKNSLEHSNEVFIFLIIPALSEQNVIKETLSFFLKSYHGDFKIILSLDQKELPDQHGITTKTAILDFIKTGADPKHVIEIVEYTGPHRSRAHQLNEGLKHINNIAIQNKIPAEKIWIGVYNADSQPHPQTLNYLLWKLTECPDIKVFQQLIDYQSNVSALSNYPLMMANSFCQTARNLIFEVTFLMNNKAVLQSGKKTSYPPYCMGNGEFIRLDTLTTVGGFSTRGPCDGIQLGICLTLREFIVEILPFPDFCQSPPSLRLFIQQHCMWFGGVIAVFKHILGGKQDGWYLTSKRVLHYIALALVWLLSPVPFIFIILYSIFYIFLGNYYVLIPLFLTVLAIFLHVRLILKSVNYYDRYFNIKSATHLNPLWIPISLMTRPIGPWLFIYRYIKSCLTRNPMTFKKMER